MKNLKTKIFAMIVIVVTTACGDTSKNDESEYMGQTYSQNIMLSAAQSDTIVMLSALNAAIRGIDVNTTWLVVTKQEYSSGAPSVRLTVTANENDSERSSIVTITATNSDKVLLTVTQEKSLTKIGMDDSHDIVSDQPANSRTTWL